MSEDKIEVNVVKRIKRKRTLKVYYSKSHIDGADKLPKIAFSGQYLNDIGYKIGDNISLVINDDKSITIRKVEDEKECE